MLVIMLRTGTSFPKHKIISKYLHRIASCCNNLQYPSLPSVTECCGQTNSSDNCKANSRAGRLQLLTWNSTKHSESSISSRSNQLKSSRSRFWRWSNRRVKEIHPNLWYLPSMLQLRSLISWKVAISFFFLNLVKRLLKKRLTELRKQKETIQIGSRICYTA